MKITLEYDLPEDEEEFKRAINNKDFKLKFDTLYDCVFRPLLKYDAQGYDEKTINYLWQQIHEHFEE